MDARFTFIRPEAFQVEGKRVHTKASIDRRTVAQIREQRPSAVFIEEGLTVYGKLFRLRGKDEEVQDENGFWGELRADNHHRWRVWFPKKLENAAKPLFLQQVAITGVAHYFEKRSAKLLATDVTSDHPRDYLAAFDELIGSEPDLLENTTLEDLLAE